MAHDYQYPAKEWQSSTPTNAQREARKEATTQAGQKALAECKAMLDATPEAPQLPLEMPCEHDYQSSPYFARALQCTKCTNLIEDPNPPKPVEGNQAPLECYEDLNR